MAKKGSGVSSAMDDAISIEDLATRGGEEDLEADDKGADRGDAPTDLPVEEEEETPAAKKEGEEEVPAEEEEVVEKKDGEEEAAEGEEETPAAKKGKAEGEEEAPAEEEEEVETGKKKVGKDGKPILIPKSRYDSLRARFDRLMEQVGNQPAPAEEEEAPATATGAKGGAKADPLTAIDARLEAIDDELTKAIADNDQAMITKLRREDRQLNQKRVEVISQSIATQRSVQAVEQLRYDTAVLAVEEQYPWLNPDHKSFDKDRALEVREMVLAFESRGYKPSAALMRAMKYFDAQDTSEEEETPAPVKSKAKAAVEQGKAKTVARNLEAAKKTPPSMAKTGADSHKVGQGGKVDVVRMTDEEFDKLPESTKARLRGDEG